MTKALLYICTLGLIICTSLLHAQDDFEWWNQKHNWDGVTPWHQYLKIAPGYMGPNALPVPDFKNGRLPQGAHFFNAAEVHNSPGDQTQNFFSELYLPLYSERVGLQLQVVPVEWYSMDTLTRDERVSRDLDGEGVAGGDMYIGTFIQLIRYHDKWPDVAMSINLRTASGTNLAGARYTDAPGYFFDLSMGRTFFLGDGMVRSIRPFFQGGFYAWQSYDPIRRQNDAPSYALGFELELGSFTISNGFGGYYGYIGDGDRPQVYRLALSSSHQFWKHFRLRFQQGLHDFEYSSLRLGYTLYFER